MAPDDPVALSERAVLADLMAHTDGLASVRKVLGTADFACPCRAAVYQTIGDLVDDGCGVDVVTVSSRLIAGHDAGLFGGRAVSFVSALTDATPSVANVKSHARLVFDHAERRRAEERVLRELAHVRSGTRAPITSPTGAPAPEQRPYQARACRLVDAAWREARAVCLVAPTGSGKTIMGAALAARSLADGRRVVWVAHRRELVRQAVEAVARASGGHVGAVCPGLLADADAAIQVGTIQTLLARGLVPRADLVVLDEAHHYAPAAGDWSTFAALYSSARVLGLTATPERRDGSALGDVFDRLVVAATYGELVAAGHLVQCHVFAPPPDTVRGGWSVDPVTAYQRARGSRAFAFFDRVATAEKWRDAFQLAGIRAAVVSDKTRPEARRAAIEGLADGRVRVICNVYTMTEGVDVPAAETVILARHVGHASMYLQMVGRVLRPAPGKVHATLLDLVDATSIHGFPTDDRSYSLDGRAIVLERPDGGSGTRTCPSCARVFAYGAARCPGCEWIVPAPPAPTVKIWNVDLQRVYAGRATPDSAKADEFRRLRALAASRGWSIGWVVREYGRLFDGERPDLSDVGEPEQRAEYDGLVATGRERAFKPGFAAARFRDIFGRWPPRDWPRPEAMCAAFDDAGFDDDLSWSKS